MLIRQLNIQVRKDERIESGKHQGESAKAFKKNVGRREYKMILLKSCKAFKFISFITVIISLIKVCDD